MDRLLRSANAIQSLHRPSPSARSINAAFFAGKRKRRKNISLSAATKALKLALSFASSLHHLLPIDGSSLDPFFLHSGGSPPVRIAGSGGRRRWRSGSGRRRWKASDARILALSLASAVVFLCRIMPDTGVRVLVPVIIGLRIAYWKRWVGFPILWMSLHLFLLLYRKGKN